MACTNPDDDDTTGMAAPSDDEAACDAARDIVEHACFPPNAIDILTSGSRPPVTDLASTAIALEGGYFLPAGTADADRELGFVLEDNDRCRVVCSVACNPATQSVCITALPEEGDQSTPVGCLFCGAFTQQECQEFIANCER